MFLIALFFSFNTFNYQESLASSTFATSIQKCGQIQAKQGISCHINKASESESSSSRRQEGIKYKIFCCDYFSVSHLLNKHVLSRRLSPPVHFLSKPYLYLEILASRCHPPTVI